MSDIKNGGAAFPQGKAVGSVSLLEGGMTLRDYFAAKAMQGLLTAPGKYSADADASTPMSTWGDFAAGAYELADAMLKEREK